MKILVISQYFWPENFKINDICLGLKERGHDVTVLTGTPNYPQGVFFEGYSFWKNNDSEWNGIKVYRSKLIPRGNNPIQLMLNYFSFPFFSSIKSFFLKEKFDKIIVYQLSPVTVGLTAIVYKHFHKAPYLLWVQDLWPESLSAAGGVNNKLVLGFFDKLTRFIFNQSQKILVQSEGFKKFIIDKGIQEENIIFCPNSTEGFYKPVPEEEKYMNQLPEGFKIMFAGNLGEAQSLITLVEAAKIVKDKGIDVKWVFLGSGRMKEVLQEEIIKNNLTNQMFLLGAFPSTEMPNFFSCASALLVSLKKEKIFAMTIPSKIQSYMACEKPILASLDGEGARVVEISNSGYTSPAEDVVSLAENVIKLYNQDEESRKQMGKNAVEYFKKEFEREILLDRLIAILQETTNTNVS